MNYPQLIMLGLIIAGLAVAAHEHGKPKRGTNSFFTTLLAVLINFAILYYGGFWNLTH